MMKTLNPEECCVERVFHPGGWRSSQCSRRGIVERGGKLYCKQHDPEAVKAKRAERAFLDQLEDRACSAEWSVTDWQKNVVKCVLAAKESILPTDVAESRRALLDAMDVLKNAREALAVKP